MKKVTVSLGDADVAAIAALQERNPLAKRHGVVRAALRAALRQMLQDNAYALLCLTEEIRRD